MKIYLYYNGKSKIKVKKEVISAKNQGGMIKKIKKRCKELDITHVQAKIEILSPFGKCFVAFPVYDVKPLSKLNKVDLETGHLAAYNIHRDRAK